MPRQILTPYTREGSYGRAFVISILGHGAIVLALLFGAAFLPAGGVIQIGTGPGGGRPGEFITVGLSAELSGGAGMYMPAITPRPTAVLPAPKEPEPKAPEPNDPNEFREAAKKRTEKPKLTDRDLKKIPPPETGQIPTTPEPGAGGRGSASSGSGGGFGGGIGISIGSGTGEGVIDSWYVRQVEQRIGANWLKTSLGEISRPVQSIVSFEVGTDGSIENVRLEKQSGIITVDLAAQRAVRASNPLPPLPFELRGRRVRFAAHFDYPQR